MLLLDKLLAQLVYPLNLALAVLLLALALLLLGRARRWSISLLAAALGWLWLWSLPVFADWLQGGLEQRYPALPAAQLPSAEAIVVLGGAMEPALPPLSPDPNLSAAADRVWHAARLYHAGKAPLIVLSGGALPWTRDSGREADAMAALLQALGVPETALLRENQSANTAQNALYSQQLLAARGLQRILLVTSALHMPRALAHFRATGLETIPASTDVEVVPRMEQTVLAWLPDAGALERSSRTFKEYLGLVACRWRGQCG